MPTNESAFINFLYFFVPKARLDREREKRVLSEKDRKRREAVNDLIYPFRAKSAPAPAPAPAKEEPIAAEEVKATPEASKKKGKRVRFAMDEPETTPEDDRMKGTSPK